MTYTNFLGKNIQIVDAPSYLAAYEEIFAKENYLFRSVKDSPFIIDCGANIGLSVIYFKKLFPDCRIVTFEPDPVVFNALKYNVGLFGYKEVELHKKAIWDAQTVLRFMAEGSVSGRLTKPGDADTERVIEVNTARLKDYLQGEVDFLKMDIEGAETRVIRDCSDQLRNVKNMFIEYHSHATEPQTLDEILHVLRDTGFRYQIKEAFVAKHPFVTREPHSWGNDLQLDIFAYRT